MKHKILFAVAMLGILSIFLLSIFLYNVATPIKKYPNDLIRFDSAVIVNGSIFTNNGWVHVGKIQIPKGYVAGPFVVQ